MNEFLQQFDFVSPEGLWNPALTGNELEDYAYGYGCAKRYFSAYLDYLHMYGIPSEEANQRLYVFVRSTVGGTPERKGFAAFVEGLRDLM
ncbi:MAG: hypothetical protein WBC26_01675, partial [Alphaproteobacteria bacterium]